MELNETAKLMVSEDDKERFKAEYWQLHERYSRLNVLLAKWDAGELDFEPTCPKELLYEQFDAMERYFKVLELRAELEGIEL